MNLWSILRVVVLASLALSPFGLLGQEAAKYRLPEQDDRALYDVYYDGDTQEYSFYLKTSGQRGAPAKVMTAEEYKQYEFENSLRNAWVNRRNQDLGANTRSGSGGDHAVSRFLPKYVLEAGIKPPKKMIQLDLNGALDVLMGAKWAKSDNPTVAEQYRSYWTPEFKMNYQVNLKGVIAEKINMNASLGSETSFEFQDFVKIDYTGEEDDIIQKIEAGNVSLPLQGSLITGSQTLFGFRTDLKFGKLTIETVISEQKGQSSTINVQGGAQTTQFDIPIDKYDANRHFFVAHYFREQYNNSLRFLPLIQSPATITRIEVWVTNKRGNFNEARNIIALDTLGSGYGLPSNASNPLYQAIRNDPRRSLLNVKELLDDYNLEQVSDFEKVESARRLILDRDYTFHPQLGYISLTSALNADEVLGVAFEYTVGGRVYKVGEFVDDGFDAPNVLYVKMLKATNLSPRFRTWDLMMKNVYTLDAYDLSKEDFVLNLMYHSDELGTTIPYLPEGNVKNQLLLQVLNLDNLNEAGNRYPDGRFDYVENVTVQPRTGRIIFPVLEPFGRDLAARVGPEFAGKYVFQQLYDSTIMRARQFAEYNRYWLSGRYKSSAGSEIILNATDIPEGSVVVMAGGVRLIENVDYTVNYGMGRVQIINPVYIGADVPLQVKVESLDAFTFINRTLIGTNLRYKVSKDLEIGGTFLRLNETPLVQKLAYGDEPLSNMIWGVNLAYQKDMPVLTKAVDALPFISTKAPSNIAITGEFAQLLPGHSNVIGSKGTTFIDDFDQSKMTYDLRQPVFWMLGSVPEYVSGNLPGNYFPGLSKLPVTGVRTGLESGFHRGELAWYMIDPLFLRNTANTPGYIRSNPLLFQKNHYVREVSEREIFPQKQNVMLFNGNISVLNLAYYPTERGPYNFDTKLEEDGTLKNPQANYGAMMRALPVTDFEVANIEYIEFWLMDPFIYNKQSKGGKLILHLGDVSEDLLRDGIKAFEQGLPYPFDPALVEETAWGYMPKIQSLTHTFDNDERARKVQDVGYDGMDNEREYEFHDQRYKYFENLRSILRQDAFNKFVADPSNDDYHYYMGADLDREELTILERYKNFNKPEGNSPVATGMMSSAATTMPNVEDINHDNTLNQLESYYEYALELSPRTIYPEGVGQNYIVDVREFNIKDPDYKDNQVVHWYQFKIPIKQGIAHNGIEEFTAIRFMRMLLTGFEDPVVLRFARLDLVRGEWRRYEYSLIETQEGTSQPEISTGTFDIASVNIEENSQRRPVNYMLPPDVSRVIDNTTNQQQQRNEQSMMFTVNDLGDGDARAAHKKGLYDMRNFKRLVMDVHAEALQGGSLRDEELSVFVRLGNDYTSNYSAYEIPLKLTPHGNYNSEQRTIVWPEENKLNIPLSLLTDVKLERDAKRRANPNMGLFTLYQRKDGKNTVRIIGNPNLGEVRVLMLGVRNPKRINTLLNTSDDGLPKSGIIWVNELRLTNFDETAASAVNVRVAATLADFGNVSVSGSYMQAGFGGLDTKITSRTMEDQYHYDVATSFELGKFFPSSVGLMLPVGFGVSEHFLRPLFNPFDPDVRFDQALQALDAAGRDSLKEMAIAYAKRKTFFVNNVKLGGLGRGLGPLSPGNFTASYLYNQTLKHDVQTARDFEEQYTISGAYVFGTKAYSFEPLKGWKTTSGWFKIIKDFNVGLYPSQYGFSTDYSDKYNEYIARSFFQGVVIAPVRYRDRTNNRNYTMTWDLTQKLKFNIIARNSSRQEVRISDMIDTLDVDHSWRNLNYYHEYNINYTLPINKIPALSWTTVAAGYRGTYNWAAGPMITIADMPDPGNTIRNTNNFQLNAKLSFTNLYNKSNFLKGILQEFNGRGGNSSKKMRDVSRSYNKQKFTANTKRVIQHDLKLSGGVQVVLTDASGKTIRTVNRVIDANSTEVTTRENVENGTLVVKGRTEAGSNPVAYAGKLSLRLLMAVRDFNLSYSRGGETTLPGYMPRTTLMGLDQEHNFQAPGFDFVTGTQSADLWGNFRGIPTEYMLTRALDNNWIVGDTSVFLNPFTMLFNQTLKATTAIEPFRDLRIDLSATHTYTHTRAWYDAHIYGNPIPVTSGAFSMSVIAIGSAFERPTLENRLSSAVYRQFEEARLGVANMLAGQRNGNSLGQDADGFPLGYGKLSPEVLVPAFESAYIGAKINKQTMDMEQFLSRIPFPNWQITYSGLSRIAALKPFIKSATLTHSYMAQYSIGSFMTNTNYIPGVDATDEQGNFYAPYSISTASLTEDIVLGGLDVNWVMGLQTRARLSKKRRIDLSLSNNQIIENNAWDGLIGLGYTIATIPQFITQGGQSRTTTLTLRLDMNLREDKNIIRKLAEDTHQLTDGRQTMALKFSAEYVLMKNLNGRAYFDWADNNPYVSVVRTSSIAFGVGIRYMLGGL